MKLYYLGDRICLLKEGKPTSYFGTIVAISTVRDDPNDVVVAVEFDSPAAYDDDYYDFEDVLVDENCIKWDLSSNAGVEVERVFNILGMTVGYWILLEDISHVKPGANNINNEEDCGGLRYL